MIHKKLLVLFIFVFLQTACTSQSVKPPAIKKASPTQLKGFKSAQTEALTYKNESITIEEIPIPKPVMPQAEHAVESKPRPVLSPAVQALLVDAEKNTKAGDLDSASVTLERALRISPGNALLTYQLAALRLKQAQPRLAEDLGKKALFLAADDRELKKRCWLLIAEARELQGNVQGAKQARLKADTLE